MRQRIIMYKTISGKGIEVIRGIQVIKSFTKENTRVLKVLTKQSMKVNV